MIYKKVFFHHDYAPASSSVVTVAKLMDFTFDIPPFQVGLSHKIFLNMRKLLVARRFYRIERILLLERDQQTGSMLDDMYKTKIN